MSRFIKPAIFASSGLSNVVAAMSLRGRTATPFANNMSWSVGDDPERVREARARLAATLGMPGETLVTQLQVHGTRVVEVEGEYQPKESDGLVTVEPERPLAVSVADCAPLLLADRDQRVVAALHSGWRGTSREIARIGVEYLKRHHGVSPQALLVWVGPAAGQCCYEVGEDVHREFREEYFREIGEGKYLFDNRGAILAQLTSAGIPPDHIEIDVRCTICDHTFHSFRRDGSASGRMLAAIALKRG